MALIKSVNSYVTVDEAELYFEDRLDVAAWETASDLQKSQSLITATLVIDEHRWLGVIVDDTQSLAFPRIGSYFDPSKGRNIDLDPVLVPARIIVATFETAYHLLNNDGLLDDSGEVSSLNVGTISLNMIKGPKKLPPFVKKMINPLLLNGGSNLWWRAN